MKLYVGKGVASLLVEELKKARKRIIVVSPWLGREYATLLKEISGKIGEVLLVTSPENNPGLRELKERRLSARTALISLVMFTLSLPLLQVLPPLGIALLILAPVILLMGVKARYPRWVHLVKDLHAKIYLIDEKVYFSSANLTRSGLHRNVEFVLELRASEEVEKQIRSMIG